jgi:F-type H+-transporting ATPase subunit b
MTETTNTSVQKSGQETKVFPPLDSGTFAPQLVWLALTFGFLYVLLKRVILPRVGEVIEARNDRIKSDLDQAEKLKADMENAAAEYEQALTKARAKAHAMVESAREKLIAEIDRERAKAEAEFVAKIAQAEIRIQDAKANALAEVGAIAGDVAEAMVGKLMGGEMNTDEPHESYAHRAAE